jgi:predicted nuclease of restriction endonuclease-like (RecB) superfamily
LEYLKHLIMSRSKQDEEREFYLRLCVQQRWSKRQLERQLAGALFERVALSHAKLSPPVRELHAEAASVATQMITRGDAWTRRLNVILI